MKRNFEQAVSADEVATTNTWLEILEQNSRLFYNSGNRCVLLQTTPKGITEEGVRSHFDKLEPGKIENIYHIADGILLVLDKEETAENFLSQKSIKFGNRKIEISEKHIPKVYEDRFLFEGSLQDSDRVKDLISGTSDPVSFEVKQLEGSKFLYTFQGDVDIGRIIAKIGMHLDSQFEFKANQLCHTDCVRVNNLTKCVKSNWIKSAFSSKRNRGGKVTKVERDANENSAYVYFSNYRDAERIVERGKANKILVGSTHVNVSLNFCNANSAKVSIDNPEDKDLGPTPVKRTKPTAEKGAPLKEFCVSSYVDFDLILFSQKSNTFFHPLRDKLQGIAEMDVTESSSLPSFLFCFKPCAQEMDDDFEYDQKHFEDSCKTRMFAFLKMFCVERCCCEQSKLNELRKAMCWNADHEYLDVKLANNKIVKVFVRWNTNANKNSHMKVTGSINDVTSMLNFVKSKCDITEETIVFGKYHFRALCECNIMAKVNKTLKENVEINTNEQEGHGIVVVTLKGPKNNVKDAKAKIHATVLKMKIGSLSGQLGTRRSEFVLSVLKNGKHGIENELVDIRQLIQNLFAVHKVNASLLVKSDQVCVTYSESVELSKCLKCLIDIVEQKTIEVEEGSGEMICSPAWNTLKQNLCASGHVQVHVSEKEKSTIEVVGLRDEFRKATNQVLDFINENVIVSQTFYERPFVVKYLKLHLPSLTDGPKKLKEVVLDFKPSEAQPFVAIKGKKGDVSEVLQWLGEVCKLLCIREHVINRPGMPEYFKSKRGRDEIERIAEKNHCVGVVDPRNEKHNADAFQTMLFDVNQTLNQAVPVTPSTLQVIVKKGNITSTTSQGIVNSTNHFDLTGALGRALIAKAGSLVAYECNHNPILQTNTIRVTTGGMLCKYILHLATPNKTSQLENVLVECFLEADRLGLKDLAVPPVGTGGIGLQIVPVAKCLASAIEKFKKKNPKNLKKIEIYVFQAHMLPDFQRELRSLTSQANPKPPSILPTKGSTPRQSVCILFCSCNSSDVDKAFSTVQEIVDELGITKSVVNNAIEELTTKEERDLLAITKTTNVLLEKKSCREITIQGLQKNVWDAQKQALDVIHRFQQALLTSQYVAWKYLDQQDKEMKDFSVSANHELEYDYKKKGNGKTTLVLDDEIGLFKVDFSKMQATDVNGNRKSLVKRTMVSSSECDQVPQTWMDMGGQQWKTVKVDSNSSEYQNVLQEFKFSLKLKPVQLDRIQNLTLWKQFEAQKRKVEQKMTNETVTRRLFHGTDEGATLKISKEGFDRNYAGMNGSCLGKGVYFATTAQYSSTFSHRDRQGHRCMILAEVLTGKYCKGCASYETVPVQQDGTPYDSVVDDTDDPGIFAVFRDACVYPLYVLKYQ